MRPSPSDFSEAEPNMTSRHQPSPETTVASRPRYRPLRHVIASMDLDILAELDRFRQWSQAQTQSPVESGSRSYWSHLQPQDVLEDLEEEAEPQTGHLLTSFIVLMLWLLSCSGIGVGIWWLVSPGEPNRLLADLSPPSPSPPPPLPDLDALPLIPVGPNANGQVSEPQARGLQTQQVQLSPPQRETISSTRALDLEGVVVQQLDQPSWLDLLQEERSQFNVSSSVSSSTTSETAAATPSPRPTPTAIRSAVVSSSESTEIQDNPDPPRRSPDLLGSQGGEGTYLVLMSYQGEDALVRARQVSSGAFVKTIDGQQYIQLAAFKQLEHARYMADDLRQKGYSVQVSGG